MDYFKYDPTTEHKYFRTCKDEDLICNLERRDEEAIDLVLKNIEGWKNVDRSKIQLKDVSG